MATSFSFDGLTNLSDREIQTLLREIDQKDVVVGLKKASKKVTEKLLGNMSERVRTFIKDEMEFVEVTADEVEAVQQRILQQAMQLAQQGQLSWPPVKRKAPKRKPRLSKTYRDLKKTTKAAAQRPLSELSYEEINQLFTSLAEIARREGILALEDFAHAGKIDTFLSLGLRFAVDGTQPQLIKDMLQTWMASLLHEQEIKYQKVIEGIMGIQSGDNPRIIEHKLTMMF